MNLITTLKLMSLFVMIWWTIINVIKFVRREKISTWNVAAQAAGITVFIYTQWLM